MKFRFLLSVAGAVVLTGCVAVPLPHITRKSPRVSGRVVDGATDRPIESAVVQLITTEGGAANHAWSGDVRPGPTAKTGANGRFRIGTKFNFHLFWYANVSWQFHWPTGAYWDGQLLVKHNGYSDLRVSVLDHLRGEYLVRVADILLAHSS